MSLSFDNDVVEGLMEIMEAENFENVQDYLVRNNRVFSANLAQLRFDIDDDAKDLSIPHIAVAPHIPMSVFEQILLRFDGTEDSRGKTPLHLIIDAMKVYDVKDKDILRMKAKLLILSNAELGRTTLNKISNEI